MTSRPKYTPNNPKNSSNITTTSSSSTTNNIFKPKRPAPPTVSPTLSILEAANTRGHNCLDYALTFDEAKNYKDAIKEYKKGIEIYKEVLISKSTGSIDNSMGFNKKTAPKNKLEEDKILKLREKISKRMLMALERVKELEKLMKEQDLLLQQAEQNRKKRQSFDLTPALIKFANKNSNESSKTGSRPNSASNLKNNSKKIPPRPVNRPSSTSVSAANPTITKRSSSSNHINRYSDIQPSTTTKNKIRSRNRSSSPKNSTSNVPKLDMIGLDKKLVESILDMAILPDKNKLSLKKVAGNQTAKQALKETVILPQLNPNLFTGLRTPPKGILLFGPPGCGKTLLAQALASETSYTFFNISAAGLTSKWVGESGKLVKTMFNVARQLQPTIIFIDEIDSILSSRKAHENSSDRQLKTEFMLQFQGLTEKKQEKLLVLAATNRPQELDDAVLRRFPKRIYIQLPDAVARSELLTNLLQDQSCKISKKEFTDLVYKTEGYSGSDLAQLAKDAAFEPIRNLDVEKISKMGKNEIPAIEMKHFVASMGRIRPSVDKESLGIYVRWTQKFGDISK